MEGHQRAIMGQMSVEEIYQDRKAFSKRVFEVATIDLMLMGLELISYTLKDITDNVGYLAALGEPRTAQVKKDARIGQADAKMQALVAEARLNMETIEARLLNETEKAKFKRDFDFKKAGYDVETNTAKANADMAYSLQAAIMQQKIKEEETQIKVIERMQEIELQEQEIQRKEKELE